MPKFEIEEKDKYQRRAVYLIVEYNDPSMHLMSCRNSNGKLVVGTSYRYYYADFEEYKDVLQFASEAEALQFIENPSIFTSHSVPLSVKQTIFARGRYVHHKSLDIVYSPRKRA